MKYKGRNRAAWTRKDPQRVPCSKWLIVCEGQTEYYYIKALIRLYRLNTVEVILGEGSAPISLVDQAIERVKSISGIDCVICVFDRDNHESYNRAINKLNAQSMDKTIYQAVISAPCFEVWLLLHFRFSAKPYASAEDVFKDLRKYVPSYIKGDGVPVEQLIEKLEQAIVNAKKLQEHNVKTNNNNPETNVHELVENLAKLKLSA